MILEFLKEFERKGLFKELAVQLENLKLRHVVLPRTIYDIYLRSLIASKKLKEAEAYFDALPQKNRVSI
jgi:hypothetical protein